MHHGEKRKIKGRNVIMEYKSTENFLSYISFERKKEKWLNSFDETLTPLCILYYSAITRRSKKLEYWGCDLCIVYGLFLSLPIFCLFIFFYPNWMKFRLGKCFQFCFSFWLCQKYCSNIGNHISKAPNESSRVYRMHEVWPCPRKEVSCHKTIDSFSNVK